MKKIIAYIIVVIFEAIIVDLIVKYANYEVAVLTLLIQILCKLIQILCKMLVDELDER